MKFLMLLVTTITFAQGGFTPFNKLKIVHVPLIDNNSVQVLVRDNNSGAINYVHKDSLGGGGGIPVIPNLQQVLSQGSDSGLIATDIKLSGNYADTDGDLTINSTGIALTGYSQQLNIRGNAGYRISGVGSEIKMDPITNELTLIANGGTSMVFNKGANSFVELSAPAGLTIKGSGAKFFADNSATYTDRSIPDVAYVNNKTRTLQAIVDNAPSAEVIIGTPTLTPAITIGAVSVAILGNGFGVINDGLLNLSSPDINIYSTNSVKVHSDLSIDSGKALILASPNGNKYKITVDNTGVLTTTLYTP